MNKVIVKANGFLEVDGRTVNSKPLRYLGYGIELAQGCTLRSYFQMITTYSDFAQLGDFFEVLDQQFARCPDDGCRWPDADDLVFGKTIEMVGFPGEPRLDIYHTLQGIKENQAHEIRSLPLEMLLDMPMRLGPLKHVIFGDRMDTFVFETMYTLFEFIDSMAWELSFHGAPAECQIRS